MKKILILTIVSCLVNYSRTASKYYDGPNIPYRFGYAIAGYQHRHEEKDEKGQIMGEFGFITADGVYHATGYGTDENGNYKILFMKNIKIGLPGEPGTQPAPINLNVEQRIEPTLPPTKLIPVPVTKPGVELKFREMVPSDIYSCSSCVIPEPEKNLPITKKPKPQLLPASFISPDIEPAKTRAPSESQPGSIKGGREPAGSVRPLKQPTIKLPKIIKTVPISKSDEAVGLDVRVTGKVPSGGIKGGTVNQIESVDIGKVTRLQQVTNGKATFDPTSQRQITGKPTDPSALDKQISLDGPSRRPSGRPGTSEQLPISGHREGQGVGTQKLSSGILYKFNYTVGYHGHHEQGDHVGAKDGGYYFVGRDGYKRTVNYNANEFGFQPHVKLVQADSQDIPREETEKEAGLKGYEFKWFNI